MFLGASGERNYEVGSIIYKYVDDYFIPFQSVELSGAMEWLPVVCISTYNCRKSFRVRL